MPVREILGRRGLEVSKWAAERLRDILAHYLKLKVTSQGKPPQKRVQRLKWPKEQGGAGERAPREVETRRRARTT